MRAYNPVDIARQFRFVRELPNNHGQRVEAIQRWCGGHPGDSWCAYFAALVLDICYQGASGIPRTGSCDIMLSVAKGNNWVVEKPAPNDLYFRVKEDERDDAHHVGFVTGVSDDYITQISGNTSKDGRSNNGDGVYETKIPRADNLVFVRIPE